MSRLPFVWFCSWVQALRANFQDCSVGLHGNALLWCGAPKANFNNRCLLSWAGRTRSCNQPVLSGRITKTIIDLAGFSFLFDRVRCGLVRSFLVRNWCGGMGDPNRRSVHLSTPGGPSPHSTPSVEPIFSRAGHPLGRRRSRPSASARAAFRAPDR